MLSIRVGVGFVPIGLSRLREENERSGVRGLRAEGEVKEDEGIEIKVSDASRIQADPGEDDAGLPDEEERGPEKAREGFGFEREPVVPESGAEVAVRQVETQRMRGSVFRRSGRACIHVSLIAGAGSEVEFTKAERGREQIKG